VVAKGIPFATNLVFDPAGGMWVTSGAGGSNPSDGVWYVPKGGKPRHVVRRLKTALGLRWAGGTLYVAHITSASNGRVTAFTGFDGTRFAKHSIALDGLRVGRHTMDSIVLGADGRLYVGVGSTYDNHGRPGRVVSWKPGSHTPRLEATGLRNPYGLAFHGTDLLVTDNGRDDLGETRPPEELDAFDPSGPVADFGFPRCSPACAGVLGPIVTFPAHASTDGLAVKGDVAYVAQNGSTIRRHAVGNDVQRVDLVTKRRTRLWRSPVAHDPLGAEIGPDGDLYVTLFLSGKVVRFNV
jgi:glucose/arabinose dehydrogenase